MWGGPSLSIPGPGRNGARPPIGRGGVLTLAAAAILIVAAAPAQAQFVCTTSGADRTCTNSGSSGAFANVTSTGTATTNNSGTVGGDMQTATTAGGNAIGNNSGSISGFFQMLTTSGGNTIGTNSGTVTNMNLGNNTGGNSTGFNSGTVTQDFVTTISGGSGNAAVTNTGTINGLMQITTTGGVGNITVTNSGTIAGASLTAFAFTSGNVAVNNSGNIGGGLAAFTNSGSASLINSGTIGSNVQILGNAGGNAIAFNSGTVAGNFEIATTGGGNAVGTNTGTISNGVIMQAIGGTSTFTNSGLITPFGPVSIQFVTANDALNLLAGSRIIGPIQLFGTNDTVNFLSGNHNLTFADNFVGTPALSGATVHGPDPFVVVGNRAVAIDPTPFGVADKNLMDFTRAVSEIVGSLGSTSAPSGPASSAFAPTDTIAARVDEAFAAIPALAYAGDAMVFKNPTQVASNGRAVWARGFGGEHVQDGDGAALQRTVTIFAGGAVGFDMVARTDLRLGLFAGAGQSRLAIDTNLGHTNTDTVFGGVYGRWSFASFGAPSFLDFALHGGGSTNTTSRTINNNAIASGLEIATAGYDSHYISPEATYGVNLPLWATYTLTPSLRVRYVAGFFDGYTETGSSANLTVASRTIQDFEERGQVTLTKTTTFGGDALLTSIYGGILGIERLGDTTVNTVVLGASLPFVTPGKSTVAGVVGGGGFEWRTREGVSVFAAGEAIGMSDSGTVLSGRGGIRAAF